MEIFALFILVAGAWLLAVVAGLIFGLSAGNAS